MGAQLHFSGFWTAVSTDPVIVWFRQDLRIADNPALSAAATTGRPVVALYILDDETPGEWRIGGASRWWLHHSLEALSADLENLGSRLILKRGEAAKVLKSIVAETGAGTVFWNRLYEPYAIARDTELKADLQEAGVTVHSSNASLLFEPWVSKTRTGGPYRVFSPFWRNCLRELPEPGHPLCAPENLEAPGSLPGTDELEDWGLLPAKPDWAAGFGDVWVPGAKGASARLTRFLNEAVSDYTDARDQPGVEGTSGLSPHLHYGDISPRTIYWAARRHGDEHPAMSKSIDKFIAELGWREFSYHLLYHYPHIPHANYQDKFDGFPWREDPEGLKAWQHGRTGYPMVDAGMRQLWQTGWMHNRVRMIVASFLAKHLMVHWRHGEEWFWDTLVDADLAANAASWQWVAGSGADAAPYFRIFNPISQGTKFDPDGDYVRKFVPELAQLPDNYLFSPWTAPDDVLKEAGIVLGTDYPLPIVNHASARERALDGYDEIKKAS